MSVRKPISDVNSNVCYTSQEAANILGVHRTTIARWAREGILKAKKQRQMRSWTGKRVCFLSKRHKLLCKISKKGMTQNET